MGLGGKDATVTPEGGEEIKAGEAGPRLPRVWRISTSSSPILPKNRRRKPVSRSSRHSAREGPESKAQDMAANSEPRIEPVVPPMPAPEPIPAAAPAISETRRNPILPANDDRRASVQELLEPLRQTSPRTPYWLAAAFSGLWVIAAWMLLSKRDGLF